MPDGGPAEAALTADYNAEMVEQIDRYPRLRDRALFVGNPDDIVPDRLGPELPGIREWSEQHFDFVGYVTGFDPALVADPAAVRAELGYATGREGLHRHGRRVRGGRRPAPPGDRGLPAGQGAGARSCGWSSSPARGSTRPRCPATPGLEVRGYVHDLYRHLAVCDLAVVQGGLTTTMELTANRRPFIYVPLRHHFEQNFHVRHRLERYRAGRCLDYARPGRRSWPQAMAEELGRVVDYRPVETDGARRAAERIADLF